MSNEFLKECIRGYFAPVLWFWPRLKKWFWNILVAVDQLLNAFLGGDPDETLSSRMGKKIAQNKCVICKCICKLLDKVQINHCIRSIETDEGARTVLK